MSKQVILYRCHFINDEIIRQYHALKEACSSQYDVVMLCDQGSQTQDIPLGIDNHKTTLEDAKAMGYPLWKDRGLHFHMDYAVLHFFKQHPDYSYYWIVEYDVRFEGSWEEFFSYFQDDDAHLLSTFLRTQGEDPQWAWWKEHNLEVPVSQLKGMFCPIIRLSKEALILLDHQHSSGLGGYCEVVIPTLLDQAGLKIKDITERFYDPIGSFNFNGVVLKPRGKLLHPVKKVGFFKRAVSLYRFIFRAKYDSHWSIQWGRFILYRVFRMPKPCY
jgi:hypothetical protein